MLMWVPLPFAWRAGSRIATDGAQQSSKPYKVKAEPKPGYIYLYSDDGMPHLRSRLFPGLPAHAGGFLASFVWRLSHADQANLLSNLDLISLLLATARCPLDQPELDLVMVPTDGNFVPYDTKSPSNASSKTNGSSSS